MHSNVHSCTTTSYNLPYLEPKCQSHIVYLTMFALIHACRIQRRQPHSLTRNIKGLNRPFQAHYAHPQSRLRAPQQRYGPGHHLTAFKTGFSFFATSLFCLALPYLGLAVRLTSEFADKTEALLNLCRIDDDVPCHHLAYTPHVLI